MNCTLDTNLLRAPLLMELEDFDKVIAKLEVRSGGITTLPFFNGERTPNLSNAKGCLFGLTSQNINAGTLLQSQIEAAAYGLRIGISELIDLGLEVE